MRLSLRRSRRTITVVAAALVAAFGLAVAGGAAVPAAAATSSCAAAYSVTTDWGSGFTASLTITDNGTAAITGWTVTYSYAGNQALANGWNGAWTQSGKAVTVVNESYNGSLAAGATTTAGANFNYSGTNAAPASVTCTPAGGTAPEQALTGAFTAVAARSGRHLLVSDVVPARASDSEALSSWFLVLSVLIPSLAAGSASALALRRTQRFWSVGAPVASVIDAPATVPPSTGCNVSGPRARWLW